MVQMGGFDPWIYERKIIHKIYFWLFGIYHDEHVTAVVAIFSNNYPNMVARPPPSRWTRPIFFSAPSMEALTLL
ncbi:hypothetical protein L2E82_19951 [Cichorium intybus]|uniref:Uncharacterized protein n=1 Tax=Cichorium intybus TaxID=13427 RepID=A0ACB9DS05_CICIN|nr:hypothetical protein L2E82_19951 [Cichorium intybus]